MDFAKKDVSELKAINKVAEKLGDSEDALTAFVSDGIDQALQLDHAFTAGDLNVDELAGNIVSGGSFTEVVGASALNSLEKRYSENEDYLEIISLNSARAQDISFALSFVDEGSEQEAALLANVDKIDAIMSLSNKFQDNEETLSIPCTFVNSGTIPVGLTRSRVWISAHDSMDVHGGLFGDQNFGNTIQTDSRENGTTGYFSPESVTQLQFKLGVDSMTLAELLAKAPATQTETRSLHYGISFSMISPDGNSTTASVKLGQLWYDAKTTCNTGSISVGNVLFAMPPFKPSRKKQLESH